MEMPVRQRSMTGRFEKEEWAEAVADRGPGGPGSHLPPCGRKHRRDALWLSGALGSALLMVLALGQGVDAAETGPKGAKEQPEGQLASHATQANDPNELWWRKWDVPIKDPNNPNGILETKWNAALKVLQAQDLDLKTKERIVDRLISPIFDWPLMSQLALGRTHWTRLDPAQREKFTRLFVERLKALYLEKTTLYTDQKVVLKPGVPKKNTIQIPLALLSEDKEITILHKLHKMDEQNRTKADVRWKIYDVEIEGVSILLTYRSQFDDILRRGTVQDLFSHLEKPPSQ
jgi:phospholipid transport system substrate-binding protein